VLNRQLIGRRKLKCHPYQQLVSGWYRVGLRALNRQLIGRRKLKCHL